MIESEWRTGDDGGRRRRYYRIRKEGRKTLQAEQEQWMEQSPHNPGETMENKRR